jgi:hypothetical protein
MGEGVEWVLVGEIYTAVRTIGNWTSKVNLTADKLYRDMTSSSSGDDLLNSIGIGGFFPLGGLVSCGGEY